MKRALALAVFVLAACEPTLFSECGGDSDCYEDEVCDDGRCEIDEDADEGGPGEPCLDGKDCQGDNRCVRENNGDPICREPCDRGTCDEGFTCVPVTNDDGTFDVCVRG